MGREAALSPLMQALGYIFRNPGLLSLALTHPSAQAIAGGDNQRLEFLGDAVLQLCVSDALYSRHPKEQEGALTRLRAALVREASLAQAARSFSLGSYLVLDHGEDTSGGRDKPSVLADAMEAVLAAVYLDGGLAAAQMLCGRAFGDFTPSADTQTNWKSQLQEREQALGCAAPVYRVVSEEGPPHARYFHVEAVLQDGRAGQGEGATKKQAEQRAAQALMEA